MQTFDNKPPPGIECLLPGKEVMLVEFNVLDVEVNSARERTQACTWSLSQSIASGMQSDEENPKFVNRGPGVARSARTNGSVRYQR